MVATGVDTATESDQCASPPSIPWTRPTTAPSSMAGEQRPQHAAQIHALRRRIDRVVIAVSAQHLGARHRAARLVRARVGTDIRVATKTMNR
jgi:hypothetical protein